MEVLDIFSGDAFSMASLTDTISHVDYKPDFLGSIGLFRPEGIPTRTVIVEEDYGTLKLVPNAPYGGTPAPRSNDKRKARSFIVPHLPTASGITAEEIQNIRAYANGMTPAQALLSVEQLRDRKLSAMRSDLEATLEFHRISALKGILLDSDGTTTIYNWFTEFGVSQQTHNMVLDTTTTNVINKVRAAIRLSLNALKSQRVMGWRAVCGDSFFDKLTGHGNFEKFIVNQPTAPAFLEEQKAYGSVYACGVTWSNYRGSVGGVDFVTSTKAYLFPEGADGLFLWKNGPADYLDRVNQIPTPDGMPIEVRAEVKPKSIELEAQSNPLHICTKPAAVIELKENT